MAKRKAHEKLTVMDAVDNLSALAELDLPSPEEIPSETMGIEEHPVLWQDPESVAENQERIKETFRILHHYLENMYEKDKDKLKEPGTQRGIQAIMVLAGEAAEKVDKYTSLFKGKVKGSVTDLKEYQDLQGLYKNKISRKFTRDLKLEEAWEKEFATEEEAVGAEKQALKDLETVRRDRNYDLFYIRKEDGKPYFNRNLLRHVRLIGDFDESVSDPEGEDPLVRMRVLQDRDAHLSAKQILQQAAPSLDEFYKDAMHHRGKLLISTVNKAVMALLLASNSRNLLSHTEGKSCLSYFADFHEYLRSALASTAYQKYTSVPFASLEPFIQAVIHLCHSLCFSYFSHERDRKEELDLIYRLIEREETKKEKAHGSPLSQWNSLVEQDEHMRGILKQYPNGPLLKIFDTFREQEEKKGFDPHLQGNVPSQLYYISNDDLHISCLRLPAPTRQEVINKAEIVEEFKGFLRILNSRRTKQKHLLINLQDRTSWHEHARCRVLEGLPKEGEFSSCLIVVTLPKDTSFYLQSETYRNNNDAGEFLAQFKDQIASGEQCGFYFPEQMDAKKLGKFVDKALSLVHKVFFSSKNVLSRKNRLDFIEIFYQLLYLLLIEEFKPDSLSFSCKDALDVGISASAGFYSFLRVMGGSSVWKDEERDFLLWMLYSPALLVRERLIDSQRFHRFLSFISTAAGEIEGDRKAIISACNALYSQSFFPKMKIEPSMPGEAA